MSMTRLKVRSGMTLTEYLGSVGPPVRKFVLHLPGRRPIAVDSREIPLNESTQHLLGKSADDWLCTEAAFKFGDEGSLITAHVWAKPRPPPAAPADVPID